jgi:hypothetical protein
MSSNKWAIIADGVVDVISYDPDREKVMEFEGVPVLDDNGASTGETTQVEVGWHWGDVLPPWVPVPDEVFAGFIRNKDGTFSAPPPAEPPPPTIDDYENAIQSVVDGAARSKQFRDGVTLASYTSSTKPQWAAEAAAFVAWRDAAWAYSYAELAKVQAGQRTQPSVAEFLTELPEIVWPESPA